MNGRRHKRRYTRRHETAADRVQPTVPQEQLKPWLDPSMPSGERVERTLAELSQEEKIAMLGGVDAMGIRGVPRLGLGRVWCSDASAGVRNFGPGTAFPAPVSVAASWDRGLSNRVGAAIAAECRAAGVSVLLGPGVNIARVPTCGRNFEYLGEDPFLAAEMAVPYVKGVQEGGVAATVKHFACNNSDYDRHRMDAVVDERTLREIYLPAFRAAVEEAGVRCVMSSYNPVNGVYASENKKLLRDILRGEWGFRGLVMSDWVSVYSTQGPMEAGLDLEMPRGVFYCREQIAPLLASGRVPERLLDEKVRRILGVFFEMGFYDRPAVDPTCALRGEASLSVALEAARAGVVLLKNAGGLLPVDRAAVRRVALLGRNAVDTPTGGGGSSHVRATDPVSVEAGLRELLGPGVEMTVVADARIKGEAARAVANADLVVVCAGFDHGSESESFDRSWRLPDGDVRLIRRAAELNPKVAVVLTAGGDVETASWIGSAAAVLHTFYLGVLCGQAIGETLLGVHNPAGKLPFTMAKRWADHPATANYVRHPERSGGPLLLGPRRRRLVNDLPASKLERMPSETRPVRYAEGLFVGYRAFDSHGVEPQFAFGHGLSYTSFELSAARLSAARLSAGGEATVSVTVRNTGRRAGSEVVQLYVEDVESSLPRPEKELKAFEKVSLAPGESAEVRMRIDEAALRFYDSGRGDWVVEPGRFRLHVGTGSRAVVSTLELDYKR